MGSRIGPCDVTSKEDLQKIYEELAKKEKQLDVLSKVLSLAMYTRL